MRPIVGLIGYAKTSENIGVFNMDYSFGKTFLVGMAFGAMLAVVPMVFLGGLMARHDLRQAAIKAKVAEYDSQTGEFKYIIMDEDSTK